MKILIVNTYDTGGAANACLRLHEGLLKEGIDSKVLLKEKHKQKPKTFRFNHNSNKVSTRTKLKLKCRRLLKELKLWPKTTDKKQAFKKSRAKELELFSFPDSNFDITESPLYKEADIINLHWVADFLDYTSFFKKNTKPVIWTLHDMNPFTGGEHYTEEHIGINEQGFPLSSKLSTYEDAIFKSNLMIKEEALEQVENLHIVVLCNWMKNEVEKSSLFKNYPMHLIPNGINSKIFQPRDKKMSRELLEIDQNKKVVLFVAASVSNHRKGFEYLKRALKTLDREDSILCAVGNSHTECKELKNVKYLGALQDERLMSMVYSAADVFVIPSLMDNLPNTVLESLMCGTPVIGFPVGGITDMVQHGENGLLTENVSVPALVDTLHKFLNNNEKFDRETIRKNALKKYDLPIQAQKYTELFTDIIKKGQ